MAETSQVEGTPETSSQANLPPKEKGKPVYELGFHLVPTLGEDGVPGALDKVRALLGDAEIISQGFPQKMTLTYRVERLARGATVEGASQGKREKYTESYFGFIKFATDRELIPALERGLLEMKEVLRSLIIETVREDITQAPRRAVFTSDRLEGKTLEKPAMAPEKAGEISEAELDKSIEALTG